MVHIGINIMLYFYNLWPMINRWFFLALLFTACTSVKVISYDHPKADFSQYQTFKIQSQAKKISDFSQEGNKSLAEFEDFIIDQMKAKGYTYSQRADLQVVYKLSSGLGRSQNNGYYNSYYYWYNPGYYDRSSNQNIEGLLEVQIKDPSSKKTVWTGSVDLSLRRSGKGNEEKIKTYIQHIFDHYPHTAGKP